MKKIIVLLSSYNGEKYIKTQIDSILNQKVDADIELIIRDDGSTDNTLDILDDFRKLNSNITVIRGENLGYVASFFELISNAPDSDYYSLSDQDDKWMEDKLQIAIDKLNDIENIDPNMPLLYGSCSFLVQDDMSIYGETQKNIRGITLYNSLIQNILPGHSQVMNRRFINIIRSININPSMIYVHDLFLTNIAQIHGKIIFDNHSHTFYRQGKENSLGYGTSKISWVEQRIKRIKRNHCSNYSKQMIYMYEIEEENMQEDIKTEINLFFSMQRNIFTRFLYVLRTKFYRQKLIESCAFKFLYLIGKYRIN